MRSLVSMFEVPELAVMNSSSWLCAHDAAGMGEGARKPPAGSPKHAAGERGDGACRQVPVGSDLETETIKPDPKRFSFPVGLVFSEDDGSCLKREEAGRRRR